MIDYIEAVKLTRAKIGGKGPIRERQATHPLAKQAGKGPRPLRFRPALSLSQGGDRTRPG